jgi:hypothetical protein
MRTILRTLVILAAALAVSGIAFGVVQSSGAQSLGPARSMQGVAAGGTNNADSAGAGDARPGGLEHEGHRSASLFGALEIVKDLVIIAIIVALVALATRLTRGRLPAGGAGGADAASGT